MAKTVNNANEAKRPVYTFSDLEEIDDVLRVDMTQPAMDKKPPSLDREDYKHISTDPADYPQWLQKAKYSADAKIEIRDGVVHWLDGEWYIGTWMSGVWHDGVWCDGFWAGGDWMNGVWEKGSWATGRWYDGIWKDGLFCQGLHMGGEWHSGVFCEGVWLGGVFKAGRFSGGTWVGGRREGGNWDEEENTPEIAELPTSFKPMRIFSESGRETATELLAREAEEAE